MCGIVGQLGLGQFHPDPSVLSAMLPCVARRGPDDEGVYCSGPVLLGHRRLSIIDLSANSHQPMVDDQTQCVICFNGTIYNYPQLRQQLCGLGHQFVSSGDTEVILRAYLQWGDQCVDRLLGMFAFAIWDPRIQKLLLARDRLGIKPLYYSLHQNLFSFASNTQALLQTGLIDRSIDPVALQFQFTLHAVVPAPRTILQGVRKVPPAHYMWVDRHGNISTHTYWQLTAGRGHADYSEQDWIHRIHEQLQIAVDRRLQIADVPVGVLLSGGLDSSLLAALIAQRHGQVKTFSVGFDDQPEESGNEFIYSDAVAHHLATDHHRFHIRNDQVLERLPEAIDQMPEPMVAQDAVAFYLLAEQVSQHIKVVQSGQGADEVFGGYFWYPQMHQASGSALQRFAEFYFDRDYAEFGEMITPQWRREDYVGPYVSGQLTRPGAEEFIDAVLRFDVTTLIVDDPVKRVDSMTMAWGLEARVPFLDHELVELSMQMPPELKLREGGKYVLKKIARELLPVQVIDRPKGYFPVPALKYVRDEFLQTVRGVLLSDQCMQRGLYNLSYIERLLRNPEHHLTRLNGSKLWHMALLEMWLQRVVDPHG